MTWRLIVIEGVDAVWKTTLAKGLAQSLDGIYYKTPGTRTPEQRKIYDRVWIPVVERFMFYLEACREDITRIKDIQSNWKDVVCDRLLASTILHQQAMDESLDVIDAEVLDRELSKTQILLIANREVIIQRLRWRDYVTQFENDSELFEKTQQKFIHRGYDLCISTTQYGIEQTLQIARSFLNKD